MWIAQKKIKAGPGARRLGTGTGNPRICHTYQGSVLDVHGKRFGDSYLSRIS
jgi:hypothetical protein